MLYIDKLLPAEDVRPLERHLLGCDRCSEIVEATKRIKGQEKGFNDVNKVVY